jgi:hypothetical protein
MHKKIARKLAKFYEKIWLFVAAESLDRFALLW